MKVRLGTFLGIACVALLFVGCCKKGEEEKGNTSEAVEPTPSGPSITGSEALSKLAAAGYTPLTDPTVSENGGIKSTAAVMKPDMIVVNVIEYPDQNMANLAASATPSSDKVLTHLAGKAVIRVTCGDKPKEKCDKVMDLIKK